MPVRILKYGLLTVCTSRGCSRRTVSKYPVGVKVYGGFGGYGINETSIDQRNFKKYKSILSGYIGEAKKPEIGADIEYNNTVVTMGNNSLLDGFTVEQSGIQGVDGSYVTSTVTNCIIKDNLKKGVFLCRG